MKKYTDDEIKQIKKNANYGFSVFMLLVFAIIIFDSVFDNSLDLMGKVISILINFSLWIFCYILGKKFGGQYLARKFKNK